jgi:predicted S18 family serine protease
MTGEVTLRGKVLPVGGIKEKILAAKRAGIQEIILCHKNRKDIEEITPSYIADLTFHYVDMVDEVLQIALMKEKVSKPINFIFPEEKSFITDSFSVGVILLCKISIENSNLHSTVVNLKQSVSNYIEIVSFVTQKVYTTTIGSNPYVFITIL